MSLIEKRLKEQVAKSLKTPQAKRDKISNAKGLIEGKDNEYEWEKSSKVYSKWEPIERIGSRKKLIG